MIRHSPAAPRRAHSAKAIVAVACAILVVVGANVALALWHPWAMSEQGPQEQDQNQGEDDQTEVGEGTSDAWAPTETSASDLPDADMAAEREAIAVWLLERNITADVDDAVRIRSDSGLTVAQNAAGEDVSIPTITSYWQLGDLYLRVLDQQGQHYVDVLTETVSGINDAAGAAAGAPNVTSNASTGDAIPAGCMATLYSRLAQWTQEGASSIIAGDAYIDDTSIAVDGTTTTFDMRGPDASHQLVVVHVSYDATSDETTFSVDA